MSQMAEQLSYADLYERWEQGNWKATEIDFSQDRAGWDGLTDIQRSSALWIYSMFFYGEDSVTDNLSPYIDAAPREEQKYFLATQQVDEARHSDLLRPLLPRRDRRRGRLLGRPRLHPPPAQLELPRDLRPPRPDGRRAARRPLAAEVRAGDRALPHGRRGDAGAARPALHRGLLHEGGHDARLQRGDEERLARRAAPHRLRREDALGVLRRDRRVQGRGGRAPARGPAEDDGRVRPAELGPRVHPLLRLRAGGHLRVRHALGRDEVAGRRLPDHRDAAGRLPARLREVARGPRRRRDQAARGRRHRRAGRRAPTPRRRRSRCCST